MIDIWRNRAGSITIDYVSRSIDYIEEALVCFGVVFISWRWKGEVDELCQRIIDTIVSRS